MSLGVCKVVDKEKLKVKKRAYTCPYCSETYDVIDDLKAHMLTAHKTEPMAKPEGEIVLTVNDEKYRIKVEPEWTLYYVVHDLMGLTGVKLFCDRGACGSCTVIMNGRTVLSCMTLAIECDGSIIQTAEGIASEDHPLVEKYVEHHAMQCGYCTPGFIVTSKALLDKNPNPSAAEVQDALAGNLCRCGTYPQHTIAVLEAAEILAKQREDAKK